jgi:hypothetical protein
MLERDLSETNAALAALMRARLGIRRGATLEEKLRHAGRLLPRAERRAGRLLVEAERIWPNPRLRRRLDPAALAAAEARLRGWLEAVDRAERRKAVLLGVLATIVVDALLVVGGVLAWARIAGGL